MNRRVGKSQGLLSMRPVYVIGIGLHPYQRKSDVSHVELGLTAVREALRDASLSWPDVDAAFVGTALLGMAPGRAILRHLGATGL
ncbi:MAG: thiolase family protein, partial [Gammaproteobacteria bacterium]